MEIVWHKQDNGVDLRLKAYESLCALEMFIVNGVRADECDFGEQGDAAPWAASEYGCGNMCFTPFARPRDAKVLKKYDITEEQFSQIADELAEALSFGKCSLCA